jgi:hypothetical protein
MKRRTLLTRGLTAMAGLPLAGVGLAASRGAGTVPGHATPLEEQGQGASQPAPFTDAQVATLKAIAAIVLPSELGRAGIDDAVDRFVRWIKAYKPGADQDHGYGFTRLRTTGPAPLRAYLAQLKTLDARGGAGRSFAALPAGRQRSLIQQSLESVDRLPARPDGRNLIADLMGFYLHSSEANDLCYRASIGRDTCRGLPGSTRAPRPRGPSGTST